MDYKFKQGTFTLATMAVIMVISVVVIVNWQTISRRINKTKPQGEASISVALENAEEAYENATKKGNFSGTQIGNDLYGWMRDEKFFESGDKAEEMESRMVTEIVPVDSYDRSGQRLEEK